MFPFYTPCKRIPACNEWDVQSFEKFWRTSIFRFLDILKNGQNLDGNEWLQGGGDPQKLDVHNYN